MRELTFACLLGTGEAEKDALRLARSIRTFGGELCFNPIWMLSTGSEEQLSPSTRQELFSLGVRLITFDLDPAVANFFLADYVTAASIVEGLAQGQASSLVLMSADTLVLQPPVDLLLQPGKSLAACPVHLKLLGSGYDDAIDEFWELIYRGCQVQEDKIFALQTIVDEQLVRAYFNAGLLVVRPERGLLRAWKADFDRLYAQPEFKAFYQQNELYEIFLHQAVLAGSLLARLSPEEFQQLPYEMNYPLHLHAQVPARRRPVRLDELITCRYEEFALTFSHPWVNQLTQHDPALRAWLLKQS